RTRIHPSRSRRRPTGCKRAALVTRSRSSPPASDLVDLIVLKSHDSLDHVGEQAHALPNRVNALAFDDDDHSGTGSAPVKDLHHSLGLELRDDTGLVVAEGSELVWLGDGTSCNSDHVRLLSVVPIRDGPHCGVGGGSLVTGHLLGCRFVSAG